MVTVTREAGNVHVGDVLYMPGDLLVAVEAVEWVTTTADTMTITALGGCQYTYRFSDTVEVVK